MYFGLGKLQREAQLMVGHQLGDLHLSLVVLHMYFGLGNL